MSISQLPSDVTDPTIMRRVIDNIINSVNWIYNRGVVGLVGEMPEPINDNAIDGMSSDSKLIAKKLNELLEVLSNGENTNIR